MEETLNLGFIFSIIVFHLLSYEQPLGTLPFNNDEPRCAIPHLAVISSTVGLL